MKGFLFARFAVVSFGGGKTNRRQSEQSVSQSPSTREQSVRERAQRRGLSLPGAPGAGRGWQGKREGFGQSHGFEERVEPSIFLDASGRARVREVDPQTPTPEERKGPGERARTSSLVHREDPKGGLSKGGVADQALFPI